MNEVYNFPRKDVLKIARQRLDESFHDMENVDFSIWLLNLTLINSK